MLDCFSKSFQLPLKSDLNRLVYTKKSIIFYTATFYVIYIGQIHLDIVWKGNYFEHFISITILTVLLVFDFIITFWTITLVM